MVILFIFIIENLWSIVLSLKIPVCGITIQLNALQIKKHKCKLYNIDLLLAGGSRSGFIPAVNKPCGDVLVKNKPNLT